jgi:hypothetical protein
MIKQKYSKEQIVEEFKKLVKKLGRVPISKELTNGFFILCQSEIVKHFKSWNNFLKLSNLKPKVEVNQPIDCTCTQCSKSFSKRYSEYKKSKNHFCSQSCAGTYNNTHKTKGTRVSKLEVYLQEQLTKLYPTLEIHYNRKDAINSELDIYIPSLKLAFELNGIFHYEPIFGESKLEQIQNNDSRKFGACKDAGISLCIIDVSAMNYFKEENAKKYLDIIVNIINSNPQITS